MYQLTLVCALVIALGFYYKVVDIVIKRSKLQHTRISVRCQNAVHVAMESFNQTIRVERTFMRKLVKLVFYFYFQNDFNHF